MTSQVISGTINTGVVLSNPLLQNPLYITNAGAVITTGSYAIFGQSVLGLTWSIDNEGTVVSANGDGIVATNVAIGNGDYPKPNLTATIDGKYFGIAASTGTIINEGTIAGLGTNSGGVYLGTGEIQNGSGPRSLGRIGYFAPGYITGTSVGIDIGPTLSNGTGGIINNMPGGKIAATDGVGVILNSVLASIDNSGTISGGMIGILAAAANVTIRNSAAPGFPFSPSPGVISGGVVGVLINGLGCALSNSLAATISGSLVGVYAMYATNGPITSSGVISGEIGVLIKGEFGALDNGVSNYSSTTGTISGSTAAVFVTDKYVAITNAGLISCTSAGGVAVDFAAGSGTLIVEPGASFSGFVGSPSFTNNQLEFGAGTAGAVGTIGNLGTYVGFDRTSIDPAADWQASSLQVNAGVDLTDSGILTVSGTTSAHGTITVAGTLNDQGTIKNAGTFNLSGTLLISGAFVNAGRMTFDGGLGIIIGNVSDRGHIIAASGTTVIAGNVSGAGHLTLDAGSVLEVTGILGDRTTNFAAGHSTSPTALFLGDHMPSPIFSGFGPNDLIDLLNATLTKASFANHILTLAGPGGAHASLHFAGSHTTSQFHLSSDSHGGTVIMVT